MLDTTTMVVAATVAVALIGGGVVFWLSRRAGAKTAGDTFFHFLCPGCKRRLRYQKRQVGHKGACSNCKRAVVFPPLSQAVE